MTRSEKLLEAIKDGPDSKNHLSDFKTARKKAEERLKRDYDNSPKTFDGFQIPVIYVSYTLDNDDPVTYEVRFDEAGNFKKIKEVDSVHLIKGLPAYK